MNIEIGYQGAHDRVRSTFGAPSEHECHAHSGHPAQEWALLGESEFLRVQPTGRHAGKRYSVSPFDYVPLCMSAHRRIDAAEAKVRRAAQVAA